MSEIQKYLDLLELPPTAQWEEVTSAYRELIKVWHPDRFAGDEKLQQRAEAKSKDLNEAVRQLRRHFRKTKLHRRSEIEEALKHSAPAPKTRVKSAHTKVFQSGIHPRYRPRTSQSATYESIARQHRRKAFWGWSAGLAATVCALGLCLVLGFPSAAEFAAVQLAEYYTPPPRPMSGYRLIAPPPRETAQSPEAAPPAQPSDLIWAPAERPEIIQASADCDLHRLKRLLRQGADVNSRDNGGDSALAWAARRNCPAAAELLLSSGANPNTIASNGFTPRDWAARANSRKISKLLEKITTR